MQIDPEAKMIYVHIPRTGGSWFSYQWPAHHTSCLLYTSDAADE